MQEWQTSKQNNKIIILRANEQPDKRKEWVQIGCMLQTKIAKRRIKIKAKIRISLTNTKHKQKQ